MKFTTFRELAFCAALLFTIPGFTAAQTTADYDAVRLNNGQPIIDQGMFADLGVADEGENINGPSLIRIPDWISPQDRADPSAVYYLYFAHHSGDYIRLAWAADIEGPWNLYQTGSSVRVGDRGVLDNGGRDINLGSGIVIEENHLASPDVHVDDENQQIIMYFHSGADTTFNGNRSNRQVSWVSTSSDGLEFRNNIEPVTFGDSYFRVFAHGGELYAFENSGFPRRALDADNPWRPTPDYYSGSTIPTLWERHPDNIFDEAISRSTGLTRSDLRIRHTAVRLVGDELQVFYSQRGEDAPERIMLSTIDLNVRSWEDWELSYPPQTILQATSGWEGGQFEPEPSETGSANGNVNQLRDPYVFEDVDGSLYLIYSGRGESGLGIAALSGDESSNGPQRTITLTPSDDSYVRDGRNDNVNYGDDQELLIKRTSNANFRRKSYVQFDLRGVFDVETAVVRLYANETSPLRLSVFEASDNWDENSVTYDNVPREGRQIATVELEADNQWYEWDVTDFVQENENQSVTFAFYSDLQARSVLKFSSKEGNSAPELRLLRSQ